MAQVLLIDDNTTQLGIREALLRGAGFDVVPSTSADRALELISANPQNFGVVVTDHLMPGTTGSEFVRELRNVNSTVPVVVISGLATAEVEYEGLDVAFRMKPCPPPELISLITAALERNHRK